MLNQRPVFLNCLARGGSNILVNLIISHPGICISAGETHRVFKGRARFDNFFSTLRKRLTRDLPLRLRTGQDYFSTGLLKERRRLPPKVQIQIDRWLYYGRFEGRVATHNLYRTEGEEYSDQGLSECRLLSKGNDGLVFTADLFAEMYPDAVFLALVRNGLAVCEGRVRRGMTARKSAEMYAAVTQRMLNNAEKYPNYHLVRFEDVINNPVETAKDLYQLVGLSVEDVPRFRLESKGVTNTEGKHEHRLGKDHAVVWMSLEELDRNISSDVNENQIRRLSSDDKREFVGTAGESLERLGYSF